MSIAMWQEIKALKARVEALEKAKLEKVPVVAGPKMCPKCNAEPAYYFHVKHCKGQTKTINGRTEETHG
jgi:hypothetical protein